MRSSVSERSRARLLELWDERERFFSALKCLAQVFSHGDCQRRNLFIRRRTDAADELLAVDWQFCGRRPLGEELWNLVASSTMFFEWEPDAIAGLDRAVYCAYLAGLNDAGWAGNPEEVRLGFAAATALCLGAGMPLAIGYFGPDEIARDRPAQDRSPAGNADPGMGHAGGLRASIEPTRPGSSWLASVLGEDRVCCCTFGQNPKRGRPDAESEQMKVERG